MDQTALFHHVFPILKKGLPLLWLEPRSLLPCNPVVDGSGRVVDVSGNVSLQQVPERVGILQVRYVSYLI